MWTADQITALIIAITALLGAIPAIILALRNRSQIKGHDEMIQTHAEILSKKNGDQ